MKTKMNKSYVAPETFSVKLDSGRMICESGTQADRTNYGEAQNLTW